MDDIIKQQINSIFFSRAHFSPEKVLTPINFSNQNIEKTITTSILTEYLQAQPPFYPQLFSFDLNNTSLADILHLLIDKLNPELSLSPANEHWNPELILKVGIIGGQYTGKRTLANFLTKKYGIESFSIEKLSKDALTLLTQEEEFKQQQQSGQLTKKPGKKAAQQQGKMLEEVLNRPESQELKAIGLQIRQWQKDNNQDGVSNEQAVQLFTTKIKQCCPKWNSKEEIIEEYRVAKETFEQRLLDKEKQKEQEDLKKKKGTKTQLSKKQLMQQQQQQQQQQDESRQPSEEELLQAIQENKTYYLVNGFALTNYPMTLIQVFNNNNNNELDKSIGIKHYRVYNARGEDKFPCLIKKEIN